MIGTLAGCITVKQGKPNSPALPTAYNTDDESTASQTRNGMQSAQQVEKRAFYLVNQYRRTQGLPALLWNETIARECRTHSRYQANRGKLSHDKFSQRISNLRSSIRVSASAENVAMNQGLSDPAMVAKNGWIRSAGHHRNIKGNYTHSGMGVVRTADGKYYLTQIFVRR
jgi:uncharacterized protein YkwD